MLGLLSKKPWRFNQAFLRIFFRIVMKRKFTFKLLNTALAASLLFGFSNSYAKKPAPHTALSQAQEQDNRQGTGSNHLHAVRHGVLTWWGESHQQQAIPGKRRGRCFKISICLVAACLKTCPGNTAVSMHTVLHHQNHANFLSKTSDYGDWDLARSWYSRCQWWAPTFLLLEQSQW